MLEKSSWHHFNILHIRQEYSITPTTCWIMWYIWIPRLHELIIVTWYNQSALCWKFFLYHFYLIYSKFWLSDWEKYSIMCYNSKTLELVNKKNLVLGLTQENLIENSVQNCLPYIQIPNGLCELFLAYPKWPCVHLKVNMCITCCMTSSLPEYFMSFHVSYDLWSCYLMWPAVWQHDLVTNPNPKF